jgi:hypothetical protein
VTLRSSHILSFPYVGCPRRPIRRPPLSDPLPPQPRHLLMSSPPHCDCEPTASAPSSHRRIHAVAAQPIRINAAAGLMPHLQGRRSCRTPSPHNRVSVLMPSPRHCASPASLDATARLTSHLRVDTAVGWTSSLHSCVSAFDDVVALHHPSDISGSTPPSRQHRVSGLMQPPDQRRRVSTSMSSPRRRISPPPMDVGSCCHGRRRRSSGLDATSTSNCPRRCCPRSAAHCVRHPRRHVPPPGLPTSSPLSTSKAGRQGIPKGVKLWRHCDGKLDLFSPTRPRKVSPITGLKYLLVCTLSFPSLCQ